MAKIKKKVTRKQLLKEPDEFITFTSKALRFAMDYNRQIIAGLIGFIILILVAVGIRYFLNKAEKEAFDQLSQSQTKYAAILKETGPEKALAQMAKDFEEILKKYSNTTGGKFARVIYANLCYKAGNLDKAIALYTESLKDFESNPFFKNLILNGLGYAHEAKKDFESATKYFDMIAAGSDPVMKGQALFNLGRLYAVKGDRNKSLDAYRHLLVNPNDAVYNEMVKEKLGN